MRAASGSRKIAKLTESNTAAQSAIACRVVGEHWRRRMIERLRWSQLEFVPKKSLASYSVQLTR